MAFFVLVALFLSQLELIKSQTVFLVELDLYVQLITQSLKNASQGITVLLVLMNKPPAKLELTCLLLKQALLLTVSPAVLNSIVQIQEPHSPFPAALGCSATKARNMELRVQQAPTILQNERVCTNNVQRVLWGLTVQKGALNL